MKPNRKGLAARVAALMVFLLIVLAVFAYTSLSPRSVSSTSSMTTSANMTETAESTTGTCSSPYTGLGSPGKNSGDSQYPVLSMPANSTAVACVAYYNPTSASVELSVTAEVESFFEKMTGPSDHTLGFVASSDFTVTNNGTSISLPANDSEPVIVAFIIHSTSKGFFYLNVGDIGPERCNMGVPLAVGYTFGQQNESGTYFSAPVTMGHCIIYTEPMVYANIVGFTGIGQTYVDCGAWICDQSQTQV